MDGYRGLAERLPGKRKVSLGRHEGLNISLNSVQINWDCVLLRTHTHFINTHSFSIYDHVLQATVKQLHTHSSHIMFLIHTQLHTCTVLYTSTHTPTLGQTRNALTLSYTQAYTHKHVASPFKQHVTSESTVGPNGAVDSTHRAQQQSGRNVSLKSDREPATAAFV